MPTFRCTLGRLSHRTVVMNTQAELQQHLGSWNEAPS